MRLFSFLSKTKVIKLRAHHIFGFCLLELYPGWYYYSDKKYIKRFRELKQNFHSDKVILYSRDTCKLLHKHSNWKVKVVKGNDDICKKCEHGSECSNKEHWCYKRAEETDRISEKILKELKIGEIYPVTYLQELAKKHKNKLIKTPM